MWQENIRSIQQLGLQKLKISYWDNTAFAMKRKLNLNFWHSFPISAMSLQLRLIEVWARGK